MAPKVTILIPNYRTRDLTCLCLRLLRRHTDPALARVMVIDNGSDDASLDYLRQVDWIELVERRPPPGEPPALAHGRALDLGLARVETPYVLSLHSDTFVRRPDWLPLLLNHLESDPRVAGVGAWKQGERAPWRETLKDWERAIERPLRRLFRRGAGRVEGQGDNWFYLRSHCALYRTELLRSLGLSFVEQEAPVGKWLHRRLEQAGWRLVFVPIPTLERYLVHANRATQVLNPEIGIATRHRRRGLRRLRRLMAELEAPRLLADATLDR